MFDDYMNSQDNNDLEIFTDKIEMDFSKDDKENTYFEYYTIKKGDTLYAISKRYNINPELLASLNGLNSADYIYPDQVILIPKSDYSYYVTKSGDTLESVANVFDISKRKLLEQNNVIYLLEGQLLVNKAR